MATESKPTPEDAYLYHEEVELSDDSGEDGKYGNVSDGDSSSDNEDLAAVLKNIKSGSTAKAGSVSR